ncbi:MAG: hypothetical protein MJ240_07975 [Kiritimatiellae bacterium]|nr:hypothetical protein [Kiritimatiellia bacterium]
MLKSRYVFAGVSALVAWGAWGSIVTNDTMPDVTSPTVFSGVTNIIAKSQDINISANLTLDKRTFLWIRGEAGTETPYVNIAPTSADATLTIDGQSGFFTAYRYSGDGAYATKEWGLVGIDELNKNTPACYYRVRIGDPDGESGTTGCGKIVVKTNPAFGYNAAGGFWATYLYVENSVKPDPKTGYVDFLELERNTIADIAHIQPRVTTCPARILFHGGTIIRNNAIDTLEANTPLAPAAGTTLVLKGVDDADIGLRKSFETANLTGRLGGSLRIEGKDFYLRHAGAVYQGLSGANFCAWDLSSEDNVTWALSGSLRLADNCWLRLRDDDLLPHGAGTGDLIIQYNSGIKESQIAGQAPYCCLDLYGTSQRVNGVTSTGTGFQIGVVTNTHATARGTLVLGTGNVRGQLNARCTANVDVVKEGSSELTVYATTGESLSIQGGTAAFSEGCVFTNFAASAGVQLLGDFTVRAQAAFGDGIAAASLRLKLDEGAKMAVEGSLVVYTLNIGGESVAPGTYTAETAPWLDSGTVQVTIRAGDAETTIDWTGAGTTASATLAANWSDGQGMFSSMRGCPRFAVGGDTAILEGGASYFMGLRFDAAGDFTVQSATANDVANLFASMSVANPGGASARTYTVAAPLVFHVDQEIELATNVTVKLLGGVTSPTSAGLTLKGVKLSALANDFDAGGRLELENLRISGRITHRQGGGWMVLRGDVGNPGDILPIDLRFSDYRNGKDKTGGILDGALTRLEGATIWKPISVSGQGQIGGLASWFIGAEGTTNVFKELISCSTSTAIYGQRNTVLIFEKGVNSAGGSFNPNGVNGSPTFIFNGPVAVTAGTRPLSGSGSRLVFNSMGNRAKLYFQVSNSTHEFTVDEAFEDTVLVFDHTSGKMELNGTHQKFAVVMSGSISSFVPGNVRNQLIGKVNGVYPAKMEVTEGAYDTAVTNCGVKFTGWVTLAKSGAGKHRMLPQAQESYGDVEVSGGALEFDDGATWLNGTNVTVKGTGTLKLGGKTFRDDCVFSLEGDACTVDLADGMEQKASYLIVDGRSVASGTWGSAESAATHKSARFAGTGVLRVARHGFNLILR